MPVPTLTAQERRGEIRRLAPGIYTANLDDEAAVIVRGNWPRILACEVPGAIITDRSAPISGPINGVIYVVSPRQSRTPITLPGLTISRRPGPGPQPGDIPLPGGIYLASKARGLLDNTMPSRARSGVPPHVVRRGTRRLGRSHLSNRRRGATRRVPPGSTCSQNTCSISPPAVRPPSADRGCLFSRHTSRTSSRAPRSTSIKPAPSPSTASPIPTVRPIRTTSAVRTNCSPTSIC